MPCVILSRYALNVRQRAVHGRFIMGRTSRATSSLCLLLCSLTAAASANAGMIVADNFTYPDGVLHGQDGGTDGIGSWLNPWGTSFVFGGVEVSGGVAQGAVL